MKMSTTSIRLVCSILIIFKCFEKGTAYKVEAIQKKITATIGYDLELQWTFTPADSSDLKRFQISYGNNNRDSYIILTSLLKMSYFRDRAISKGYYVDIDHGIFDLKMTNIQKNDVQNVTLKVYYDDETITSIIEIFSVLDHPIETNSLIKNISCEGFTNISWRFSTYSQVNNLTIYVINISANNTTVTNMSPLHETGNIQLDYATIVYHLSYEYGNVYNAISNISFTDSVNITLEIEYISRVDKTVSSEKSSVLVKNVGCLNNFASSIQVQKATFFSKIASNLLSSKESLQSYNLEVQPTTFFSPVDTLSQNVLHKIQSEENLHALSPSNSLMTNNNIQITRELPESVSKVSSLQLKILPSYNTGTVLVWQEKFCSPTSIQQESSKRSEKIEMTSLPLEPSHVSVFKQSRLNNESISPTSHKTATFFNTFYYSRGTESIRIYSGSNISSTIFQSKKSNVQIPQQNSISALNILDGLSKMDVLASLISNSTFKRTEKLNVQTTISHNEASKESCKETIISNNKISKSLINSNSSTSKDKSSIKTQNLPPSSIISTTSHPNVPIAPSLSDLKIILSTQKNDHTLQRGATINNSKNKTHHESNKENIRTVGAINEVSTKLSNAKVSDYKYKLSWHPYRTEVKSSTLLTEKYLSAKTQVLDANKLVTSVSYDEMSSSEGASENQMTAKTQRAYQISFTNIKIFTTSVWWNQIYLLENLSEDHLPSNTQILNKTSYAAKNKHSFASNIQASSLEYLLEQHLADTAEKILSTKGKLFTLVSYKQSVSSKYDDEKHLSENTQILDSVTYAAKTKTTTLVAYNQVPSPEYPEYPDYLFEDHIPENIQIVDEITYTSRGIPLASVPYNKMSPSRYLRKNDLPGNNTLIVDETIYPSKNELATSISNNHMLLHSIFVPNHDLNINLKSDNSEVLHALSLIEITKDNVNEISYLLSKVMQNISKTNDVTAEDINNALNLMASCLDVTSTDEKVVTNLLAVANTIADTSDAKRLSVKHSQHLRVQLRRIGLGSTQNNNDSFHFDGRKISLKSLSTKYNNAIGLSVTEDNKIYKKSNLPKYISERTSISIKTKTFAEMPFNTSDLRMYSISFGDSSIFQGSQENQKIVSSVLDFTIANYNVENLETPISLLFKVDNTAPSTCVFWNEKTDSWKSDGCITTQMTHNEIKCRCNHLTSFAVLLNIEGATESQIISNISFVGCIFSICGLSLTLMNYALFRQLRNTIASKIVTNMCISIIALLFLFLFGIKQTSKKTACTIIASLIQFFLLSTFLWMAIMSLSLYRDVVKPIEYRRRGRLFIKVAFFLAWGIPTIIVASISQLIKSQFEEQDKSICAIEGKLFFYSSVCPVAIILTFNLLMYLPILYSLQKHLTRISNYQNTSCLFQRFRDSFVCAMLLGLTWIFGLLCIGKAKIIFEYIFAILNSFQGFFIFITHVVNNNDVRKEWANVLRKYYKISKRHIQVGTIQVKEYDITASNESEKPPTYNEIAHEQPPTYRESKLI